MKKMKRIRYSFAIVTIVSLLPLTLAACSSSSDNGGASSPNGGAAPSSSAQQKGKLTVAVHDRGSMPEGQGTIDKNWATEWINEHGPANVKFIPIPRWTDTSKYNTLFAAGDAPDIVWSYDSNFKGQLINQKLALPLAESIDKFSTTYKGLLEQYPGLKKLTTDSDGNMYQIGRINGLQPNHALFIRTDWLEKLNLKVPQTTDELFEVAKAFATMDPDGNSKNDTYGIALSGITGQQIDYMYGNVSGVEENGNLVHGWNRQADATSFRKQLFDAGVVDKDFLNDKDGSKAKQAWVNGKLGIYGDNISLISGEQTYATLKKNVPEARAEVMPLPKSSYGQFSGAIIPPIQIVGVVNADVKSPESAIRYIDFLSDKATMTELAYGDADTDYKLTEEGYPKLNDLGNPKLTWTGDLNMLMSTANFGSQAAYLNSLNPEDAADQEWMKLYEQAQQAYLSPDRPWPGVTWGEFMPALPANLQTVNANMSQIGDFFSKAVVSGKSYTVEQALKDAQSLWDKAGGKDIDAWWEKWYADNKDSIYLTKDMYSN